ARLQVVGHEAQEVDEVRPADVLGHPDADDAVVRSLQAVEVLVRELARRMVILRPRDLLSREGDALYAGAGPPLDVAAERSPSATEVEHGVVRLDAGLVGDDPEFVLLRLFERRSGVRPDGAGV